MIYYIYQHVRLDTNEIFYIGKGKRCTKGNIYRRAFTKSSRNNHWKNIVKSVPYKVEILEEFISENQCLKRETELIKQHGYSWNNTGTLCNIVEDSNEIRRLARINSNKSNSKEVHQYDLDGNYIRSFPSIISAKREYHCDIYNAASGRVPTAGKFQWRLIKFEKILSYSSKLSRINKSKKIYQYDIDNNFIREWKGTKEISDVLKINRGSIRNCLSGRSNTANGFKWSYNKIPKDISIKKYNVYKEENLIFSSNKLKKCAEYLNLNPIIISTYLRRGKLYKGYMFKYNNEK